MICLFDMRKEPPPIKRPKSYDDCKTLDDYNWLIRQPMFSRQSDHLKPLQAQQRDEAYNRCLKNASKEYYRNKRA